MAPIVNQASKGSNKTLKRVHSILLDDPFGSNQEETGNFSYGSPEQTFGILSSQADYVPKMRVGSTNSRGGGYSETSTKGDGGGILRSQYIKNYAIESEFETNYQFQQKHQSAADK